MTENSVITVNTDAISRNLNVLKSYCDAGVEQMAVIKANAYGHGLVEVASAVAGQVKWFAVNDISEAIALRKAGIENAILVFGVPEKHDAQLYKKFDVTATVSSLENLDVLKPGTEYHLNFDTGMGRLGFRPEEAEKVNKQIRTYTDIHCTGIYSHFATADEPDSPKGSQQLQLFNNICRLFPNDLLVHMCNTAATVQFSDAHFDLVRNGIGMYGYAPGRIKIELSSSLGWTTRLVQVKKINKSETVSYGATWAAPENGYTGVIPVGYSDGIPRNLSGKFQVHIHGEKYAVVGTVTMNYCMVWLGKQKLPAGTEVELIGQNSTAETWAETAGTIPYEILTGLSPHITRHYAGLK